MGLDPHCSTGTGGEGNLALALALGTWHLALGTGTGASFEFDSKESARDHAIIRCLGSRDTCTAQGSMIPGCRNTHSVFHAKAELQCPKPSLVYLRSSECSHQRGMNRTGGACALNRSFGTSQMFLPGIFQLALAHPYHTILFSRPHQLQSATRCVSRSRAQTPRDAVNKCMETRRRRQAAGGICSHHIATLLL